jgi:hypothetical protein
MEGSLTHHDLCIQELSDENQALLERLADLVIERDSARSLARAAIDLLHIALIYPDRFEDVLSALHAPLEKIPAEFVAEIFREGQPVEAV